MGKTINTDLPKTANTEAELYSALLRNNPGITIAEDHGSTKAFDALANNMALFKKEGVDTVYVEMGKDAVSQYNGLSVEQLRHARKALDNLPKENPEFYKQYRAEAERISREDFSGHVSAKSIMNRVTSTYDMVIAARENDVRIVSFEGTEAEMLAQANEGMSGRIVQTNKDWTNAIRADRVQVDPKGEGKFVIMGGNLHFTNTIEGNGTVAQQLGTPVVGHTRSVLPAALYKNEFYKGDNPNGADFYIRSGPRHPDLKEFVLPKETARPAEDVSAKETHNVNPRKKTSALSPGQDEQAPQIAVASENEKRKAELERAKELAENNPQAKKAAKGIQQEGTPGNDIAPGNQPAPVIADNGRGESVNRTV